MEVANCPPPAVAKLAFLLIRACSLSLLLGLAIIASGSDGPACPLVAPLSAFSPSVSNGYSSPITPAVITALETDIELFIANYSIPFYAVTVVKDDQTIFTTGMATTPFMIGSITKTFTALAALVLRERGLLSLDDPITKFLPSFSIINPYEPHNITLRELMGHVSGLPRELCTAPIVTEQSEQSCPIEESDVLESVAKMQLIRPPWSREPAYSNLGFGLLGHAWEKATSPSKSWDDFILEDIVAPLGLNGTGIDLTKVMLPSNETAASYDIGWVGPAGSMYSTAADLAKYLIFLLKGTPAVISGATIREWTNSRSMFADGNGGFALPWELLRINSTGGDFLITKAGVIGAYRSVMAIHTPTQLGIALLFGLETSPSPLNISSLADPAVLMAQLLDVLIPLVEGATLDAVDAVYAGRYVCEASAPIMSDPLNVTVQTVGGALDVQGSPSLGLTAAINLSLVLGPAGSSVSVTEGGTVGLLLKNASENSFWANTGQDCLSYFMALGATPSTPAPNAPGTPYLYEVQFNFSDSKSQLLWPALGSVCDKQ